MSIITKIDGIPLFSTKEQALRWGKSKGVLGHHEHTHFGQKGYMAGATHSQATGSFTNNNTSTPSGGSSMGGGSTGGGGGGGY